MPIPYSYYTDFMLIPLLDLFHSNLVWLPLKLFNDIYIINWKGNLLSFNSLTAFIPPLHKHAFTLYKSTAVERKAVSEMTFPEKMCIKMKRCEVYIDPITKRQMEEEKEIEPVFS